MKQTQRSNSISELLWQKCRLMVFGSILTVGCGNEVEPPPEPEVPQAGEAIEPEVTPEMDDEPTPAPAGQSEEPEESEPSPTQDAADEVSLQTMSWDEAYALIGQHQGKVVVFDLWSTTCPPCLEELPGLVELSNEYPEDVRCISVSLDYAGFEDEPPESFRAKVHGILKRIGADFQNVLCSTDFNDVFGKKIPHRSFPVVLVFDRQGKQAGEFPDPKDPEEFTYQADIAPFVAKLVEQN